MSPEQRQLARHALGLPNDERRTYRNRFYASSASPAWEELHDMVGHGWMNAEDSGARLTLFWLTTSGAKLALDPGERLDREDFPDAA